MAQDEPPRAGRYDVTHVRPPTSTQALEIEETEREGVTILGLKGKLQVDANLELLTDRINTLIQNGCRKLVLNLHGVSAIDSSGLGMIIGPFTLLRCQGGQLKLLKVSQRIRELLVLTELATVIESFDEEADVVRSFPR